jgi:hypothetical protein
LIPAPGLGTAIHFLAASVPSFIFVFRNAQRPGSGDRKSGLPDLERTQKRAPLLRVAWSRLFGIS